MKSKDFYTYLYCTMFGMEESGYVSILKESIKMKQKEWIFVKYRMGVNKTIT